MRTGIGVGLAQVFDNSQTLARYMQLKQIRYQREQQDKQDIARVLSQFDPTKIRTADAENFKNKYNKLQTLYIENKDLYSNPLSNIEKWKEAQSLQNDLFGTIRDSRDQEKTFAQVGAAILKNPDLFDSEAIDLYKKIPTLTIDEIKNATKGRLLNPTDFEHKPKPIDYASFLKDVDQLGMSQNNVVSLKPDANNGLQEGQLMQRVDKVYDPTAIGATTETWWEANDNFRKNYTKQYNDASQDHINVLQQEVDNKLGPDKFQIHDAQSYAKADTMTRFLRVQDPNPKIVVDPEFKKREEERRDQRNYQQQLALQTRAHNLAMERIEANKKANGSDDQLLADSNAIVDALKSGDMSTISKVTSPIFKIGSNLTDKVTAVGDFTQPFPKYLKEIRELNKKAGSDFDTISDADAKLIYDHKAKILVIPIKKTDGSKKYVFINPVRSSSNSYLYGILKKYAGGTVKSGISQDYP